MKLDELLKELEEKVKPFYIKEDGKPFDDVHDWLHMKRVYNACLKMLELEPTANRGEILIAALFHDTGRSNGGADAVHAEDSYEIAKEVLPAYAEDLKANNIDLEKVTLMVKYHTIAHMCPDPKIAKSLEFNIFTDGDKIDAFGPIGILRISIGHAYQSKAAQEWLLARIEKMAQPNEFQLQSKAGQIVGQKQKDYLKIFMDTIKAQREEFE
jgi:HD superfamily phosphodiesterase